jgi:deoxyribodipyrimidine photo-lyase
MQAARAARDRIWAVRRGAGFGAEAEAIQARHGSRRSGTANRGRRGARADRSGQLDLPL